VEDGRLVIDGADNLRRPIGGTFDAPIAIALEGLVSGTPVTITASSETALLAEIHSSVNLWGPATTSSTP
jgi:hypothetical protein